jgi:hypothetical protein
MEGRKGSWPVLSNKSVMCVEGLSKTTSMQSEESDSDGACSVIALIITLSHYHQYHQLQSRVLLLCWYL